MLLNLVYSWKRTCQRSWLYLLSRFHKFFVIIDVDFEKENNIQHLNAKLENVFIF